MAITIEQVSVQVVHLNTLIQQQQGTITSLASRLQAAEDALQQQESQIRRGGLRGHMDVDSGNESTDYLAQKNIPRVG